MSLRLPYSNDDLVKLLADAQTVIRRLLGGGAGQVLAKTSPEAYDMTWQDPPQGGGGASLPEGGTAGQVLTKQSDTDGDAAWANPAGEKGEPGPAGEPGAPGFSPVITENPDNSQVSYKLDVTTAEGSFTTPNLQAVSFVQDAQVYSAEETVVGQWVDGKPVYRIVVVGMTPSTANSALIVADLSNLSIDSVCNIYGVVSNEFALCGYTSGDYYTFFYVNSKTELRANVGKNRINRQFAAVLEFTKTTDEPTIAVATVNDLNNAYDEGVQSA